MRKTDDIARVIIAELIEDFSGGNLSAWAKVVGTEVNALHNVIKKGQKVSMKLLDEICRYYKFTQADFFLLDPMIRGEAKDTTARLREIEKGVGSSLSLNELESWINLGAKLKMLKVIRPFTELMSVFIDKAETPR